MALSDEEKRLLDVIAKSVVSDSRKFFGFKIQDLVVLGGIILGVVAFYLRTNDAMDRLIKSTDWLMDFSKNSDAYHSAVIGTQFEQGQPKNPGYDYNSVRNLLSKGDSGK